METLTCLPCKQSCVFWVPHVPLSVYSTCFYFIHVRFVLLPQSFLLVLLLVEDPRHTVGELGPVGVQAAAPAGGEPGEEPGLLAVRPVAGTLLLARSAVARNLQTDILDQVPTEGSPPRFLDVQEHDHVLPLDLEIDRPLQVPDGEEVFLNVVGVRSGEDVPFVLFREITVRGAETDPPRGHVLIENQHKTDGSDDDQQEFAAPLDHDPAQCGSHSALPFPSRARDTEQGARLLHVLFLTPTAKTKHTTIKLVFWTSRAARSVSRRPVKLAHGGARRLNTVKDAVRAADPPPGFQSTQRALTASHTGAMYPGCSATPTFSTSLALKNSPKGRVALIYWLTRTPASVLCSQWKSEPGR